MIISNSQGYEKSFNEITHMKILERKKKLGTVSIQQKVAIKY